MANYSEQLRELHEIQKELANVREKIEAGPRQIRVQTNRLKKANEAVAEQEGEVKRIRSIADQKNLDLKSREARIIDLKVKLNQAQNNKEYEAITGQITADETATSVLEDEILEVFERLDAANSELVTRQEAVSRTTEKLTDVKTAWAEEEAGLREEEAALDSKSQNAESFMEAKHRQRFRREAEAAGEEALAPVENGTCTGCMHRITPQQQVMVKQGQIVFCQSCDRLLYKPETPVVT